MPGIYIHIPFCRQKCHYCNFFSVATLKYKDKFLQALLDELYIRRKYLKGEIIRSIYLGGGTPSYLNTAEIDLILRRTREIFTVSADAEITLEANPDDINEQVLRDYLKMGINRLSIGVQSFFDEDLQYLNRIHHGRQSATSCRLAVEAGFTNISADLIYGMPTLTNEHLIENIRILTEMNIPHISAYALTVESKTALAVLIRKRKLQGPEEDQIVAQFRLMMESLKKQGYLHYEISNFCREGFFSRHNSMYWSGEHYLGAGPSAHSYNGISRQWNVASNVEYIDQVRNNDRFFESETLTPIQRYNEYIMTSLRTMWGCDPGKIRKEFGEEFEVRCSGSAARFIESGDMVEKEGIYYLTDKGKLFADGIAADLFMEP